MKDGETDWGWGILINAARKKLTEAHSVLDDSEPQWVLDVFLPCDPETKDKPPVDGTVEGRIFPMALTLVQKISKIRSNMPTGDAWQQGEQMKAHPIGLLAKTHFETWKNGIWHIWAFDRILEAFLLHFDHSEVL